MATAAFNWAEYLRLATDLSQNADEASHRTSISRAYYSIFHAATSQARRNGFVGATHKGLWAVYAKDADRRCRKLAQKANTMKVARTDADYLDFVPRVFDRMAQQLIDANDFMTLLGQLPATAPQP